MSTLISDPANRPSKYGPTCPECGCRGMHLPYCTFRARNLPARLWRVANTLTGETLGIHGGATAEEALGAAGTLDSKDHHACPVWSVVRKVKGELRAVGDLHGNLRAALTEAAGRSLLYAPERWTVEPAP